MLFLSLFLACDQDPPQEENECVDIERSVIEDSAVLDTVDSNLEFAFSIYSQRDGEQENIFMSPYSISTALGMLHLGAETDTEIEMSSVLGVFDPQEDWHRGQGTLVSELQLGDNCDYQISTANRAYLQVGYNVEQDYVDGLSNFYASPAQEIDFASDPEAARTDINSWVSEQTKEKIPELFPANSISSSTKLVLTNAIYLNAPWKTTFDTARTFEMNFTLADGSTTTIDMMTQDEVDIGVSEQEGFLVAQIPYKGDELVLTVVLPDDPAGLDVGTINFSIGFKSGD